jgi:hypothetical protein
VTDRPSLTETQLLNCRTREAGARHEQTLEAVGCTIRVRRSGPLSPRCQRVPPQASQKLSHTQSFSRPNINRPADPYPALDFEECCNSTCASRKWRSNGCPTRMDDVPTASFTKRTASAHASAAKHAASCRRIFASFDRRVLLLATSSYAASAAR